MKLKMVKVDSCDGMQAGESSSSARAGCAMFPSQKAACQSQAVSSVRGNQTVQIMGKTQGDGSFFPLYFEEGREAPRTDFNTACMGMHHVLLLEKFVAKQRLS